ncbi:MAG: PQQ-binding-like beta-propeller repeat protein [Bacteroidota bacterium]
MTIFRLHRSFVVACIGTVLIGCASLHTERVIRVRDTDWTTYGGSTERSNRSRTTLTPPLTLRWKYDAAAGFGSGSPVAADSLVFVGTLQGELHAVHIKTGERVGYKSFESAIVGAPVIDGNTLIVTSALDKPTLIAYNVHLASVTWSRDLGPIETSPLLVGNRLIVTTLAGSVVCVDKSNGEELWNFEAEEQIHSSPASDGTLVVFGCDDGSVYALSISDGSILWRMRTQGSVFAPPTIRGTTVFIGSTDNTFSAISLMDGTLKWKREIGSRIYGGAACSDDLVYIGAANGTLYALDVSDGTTRWSFKTKSVINSAPLVAGEIVYVGSLDTFLYAIDAHTGQSLWEYRTKGRIKTSLALWGDYLIVASEDKFLYAFQPAPAPGRLER